MIYLLDTNACIQLINNKHPVILEHFRQHSPADIALCSVVKAELLFGAQRSGRIEANLQRLMLFLSRCKVCLLMTTVPTIMHGFALVYMPKAS